MSANVYKNLSICINIIFMKKREALRSALVLISVFLLGIISNPFCPVEAASTELVDPEVVYTGNNVEAQNYNGNWSSVIRSYLSYDTTGTLMRVQGNVSADDVLVEYYDMSYNVQKRLIIPGELPIFGGFYETDNNYYLLTGQNNPEESNDVEVFRITKYDKNWNRLGSCGLYGANTTIPFRAGSARMTSYGKYLLVRTSHQMYTSSDGLNHQANVTIQVDTEAMVVTDAYYSVMNTSYGYVSHSFNQFIKVEDGHIVAVDHGDAYPRSLVLINYQTDVATGKFTPGRGAYCVARNFITFPGNVGENQTGHL